VNSLVLRCIGVGRGSITDKEQVSSSILPCAINGPFCYRTDHLSTKNRARERLAAVTFALS
jgi:hypothetical protein